jgi:uncharacterized protein
MEKIFLDTSFLYAYYDADDKNHEEAIILADEISDKDVDCLISDYIIDELLTLLVCRVGKLKAIKLCNDLIDDINSGNIGLICVDRNVFNKALEIFVQFKDKTWSFTDCTSYVIIKNASIAKTVSFDEHFRQFGIEILPLENR